MSWSCAFKKSVCCFDNMKYPRGAESETMQTQIRQGSRLHVFAFGRVPCIMYYLRCLQFSLSLKLRAKLRSFTPPGRACALLAPRLLPLLPLLLLLLLLLLLRLLLLLLPPLLLLLLAPPLLLLLLLLLLLGPAGRTNTLSTSSAAAWACASTAMPSWPNGAGGTMRPRCSSPARRVGETWRRLRPCPLGTERRRRCSTTTLTNVNPSPSRSPSPSPNRYVSSPT